MGCTLKVLWYYIVLSAFLQIFVASQNPLPVVSDLPATLNKWSDQLKRERDEAMAEYQRTWITEERLAWNNKIREEEKFLRLFLQNFIAGDLTRGTEKVTQTLKMSIDRNAGKELQKILNKIQFIEHLKLYSIILTLVVSHGKLLNDFPDIWGVSEPFSATNFQPFEENLDFSVILGNMTRNFPERLSEIKSIVTETIFKLSIAHQPYSVFKIKLMENLQKFYGQLNEVNKRWEKEKESLLTSVKSVSTAVKLVKVVDDLEDKLAESIEKMKQEISGSIFEKDDFCDLFTDFRDHALSILEMKGPIFRSYKKNRMTGNFIFAMLTRIRKINGRNDLRLWRSQILTSFNQSLVTLDDLLSLFERNKKYGGIFEEKMSSLKLQLARSLNQMTTSMMAGLWPLTVNHWSDGDLAGWVMIFDQVIKMVMSHVNQGQNQVRLFETMKKGSGIQAPTPDLYRFWSEPGNYTGKVTELSGKQEEIINITNLWAFPFEQEFFEEIREVLFVPAKNFSDTAKDIAVFSGLLVKNIDLISERLKTFSLSRKNRENPCRGTFDPHPFARIMQTPDNLFLAPLFEGKPITVNFTIESSPKFKDVLKFRRIGVNFRIDGDSEMDKEFQENIMKKRIYLTHSGRSVFRYNGQIFHKETEPMEFYFSMVEDPSTQQPKVRSRNYVASRNGEMPLSPYTVWKIQFHYKNIDSKLVDWAEEFGHLKNANITLELTGDADFVLNRGA